ncbi:hypothetical protein E4K72_04155 [Oxalobacteraceae bacterium OM1]|nr:hypothetical protein E4K72_04155 [Oxalobacteraceae bacterium OM1]
MNLRTRMQLAEHRRRQLTAVCQWQRVELMDHMEPLEHALTSVQTGWRIVDRIRRHPGWLLAGAAGLLLISPKRLSGWMRIGTNGLRMYRQFAPMLRQIGGPR